jgi:hypothetical protein
VARGSSEPEPPHVTDPNDESTSVLSKCFAAAAAAALAVGLAACSDSTNPRPALTVTCPASTTGINSAIVIPTSVPVVPASVTPSNVVVYFTDTGLPVPGVITIGLTGNGASVVFTPSQTLPFDTRISVRVQNLLALGTLEPLQSPIICQFLTPLPPITELFWRQLPSAGGNRLIGAALVSPESGFVMSIENPIYRRQLGEFVVMASPVTFSAGLDISFVDANHGFASYEEARTRRSQILETLNGGLTFDSVTAIPQQGVQKLYFKNIGNKLFGVAGGGVSVAGTLFKFNPTTRTLSQQRFGGTSNFVDIDFLPDTSQGVAVSQGTRIGTTFNTRGRLMISRNGGATWTEILPGRANDIAVEWLGTAVRQNGVIFEVGGSGYIQRLTPAGAGNYTVTRLLENVVTNPDSTDFEALIYTDVEFARDDDNVGWIIGAQRVGGVSASPRYQGLIFITRDGGNTWIRQGVRDAPNFGAEFPRLNRLSVLSKANAWIVGDGGTVLSFQP